MDVSVIIPYNKDRGYLEQAIGSLENQTVKPEIILSKSNGSVSYNINQGIKKAKGKYIRFCSEDNTLPPYCIERSLMAIEGFDFIHGNAVNFWDNGREEKYIPKVTIPTLKQLVDFNYIHGGTVMYRKDCFERFGGFDESLWCAEEYEFNMRLLYNKCTLNYCNAFLQRYRRHRGQKSLGNTNRQFQAGRQKEISRIRSKFR